jgi:quinol monooxygenase YgiN
MLVILWEFRVKPDRRDEFEAVYRDDGAWVELFREAPGYVSSTLMRDERDPLRYLVSDRWTSAEAFDAFRRAHATRYEALDERCRRLTDRETEIGRFDFVD